jgi:hypothetical protein
MRCCGLDTRRKMYYAGNLRVACGWLVVGQAVVRMETGTICRAGRRKTVPPDDHTRFVAGIVQVNMGSEKILGVSNALARQNAERATQQPASPIPAFAKLFWLLASGLCTWSWVRQHRSQTPMVVLSTSRGGCTPTASPQSRPWTRDPCSQTMEANVAGTSMVNATVGLLCPAVVLRSCFFVPGLRCGCCSLHRPRC